MPGEAGAFLVLVALIPGWWFIRQRERRTGDQRASNLDELLQVLVAGLATTGISLSALILWPWERLAWLVDVPRLLREGDSYVPDNLASVVLTAGAVLLVAIAMAHGAALWMPLPKRRLNDRSSMWVNALLADDTKNHKYISAELIDGRVFEGYLEGITPEGAADEQVMALGAPLFVKQNPAKSAKSYSADRIALPVSQLKYAAVVLRRTD
ncbi:DUF6338 family protein [Arthrobacter sp. R4]|uniref:DUF6338 family protein n=1 Tax=Arthrobacter sp. R4 TaxID=644417 RepID=UPI003ED87B2B